MANHLFWKMMYYLVIQEDARIIEMSPDYKQIWLEYEGDGRKLAIRLARVEYHWMKDLEADIRTARKMFKRLKKIQPSRKWFFQNMYVSTYPPADQETKVGAEENDDSSQHYFIAEEPVREVTDSPSFVFRTLGMIEPWESVPEELTENEHEEAAGFYRKQVLIKKQQLDKQDRSLLIFGKPRLTYLLLAAIVFVFFAIEQAGGSTDLLTLIEFGAKYNPAILDGEWWRLFSSMFLHIGFLHIFMNSLALFYLGGAVERMYGTLRFSVIYLTAGLFGSLASFACNEQVSAGASGAIFGCFGALLYFGLIHRQLFFRTMGVNVLFILAINLVFGFVVPAVDNGAHIGGLAGGFLASAVVHLPKHRNKTRQLLILVATILCAGILYGYGVNNDNKSESVPLDLQLAQEYLEKDNIQEAEEILQDVLRHQENEQAYFLLGNVFIQENKYEQAAEQFREAISLDQEFLEAYYNLVIVSIELEEYAQAREYLATLKEKMKKAKDAEHLDVEKLEKFLAERTNT
nr:rhomboid family intramembrane serine protease [Bacillus piscicola]